MQIVTITVKTSLDVLVQGVSINLYDQSNQFVTSGTTDVNGVLTLSLPEATYTSYYYKQGVTITQPVTLIVSSNSKNFIILATIRAPRASVDNKLITVYGFVNGQDGKPIKSVRIVLIPEPINIINTALVYTQTIAVKSDETGWFEFTLLKNTKYKAQLDGYADILNVQTANQETVLIQDFLFPLPVLLTLSSTNISLALLDGQNTDTTYTLRYTDATYKDFSTPWSDLFSTHTDPSIAEIHYLKGKLLIVPLKRGTTVITITRIISPEYIWSPEPQFIAPMLTITVT